MSRIPPARKRGRKYKSTCIEMADTSMCGGAEKSRHELEGRTCESEKRLNKWVRTR
jgi:hypothetical protein